MQPCPRRTSRIEGYTRRASPFREKLFSSLARNFSLHPGGAARLGVIAKDAPMIAALPPQNQD
ncbi:hypothetical protein [Rothia nasisuis]|uniref:hypothetical protein n=1 Tax=Rothia nasisuis TaxID=2109647 RepID=UPI001F32C2BB|nr:hypothetical protein [Rothia nasisuis]